MKLPLVTNFVEAGFEILVVLGKATSLYPLENDLGEKWSLWDFFQWYHRECWENKFSPARKYVTMILLHLGYRLLQAHAQKDFTFFCVHETPMFHQKWVCSTTLKGYTGRDHYNVSYEWLRDELSLMGILSFEKDVCVVSDQTQCVEENIVKNWYSEIWTISEMGKYLPLAYTDK